jgi:hypothetical protein
MTRARSIEKNAGERRGETKALEYREEIRVSYPIVGLLLV